MASSIPVPRRNASLVAMALGVLVAVPLLIAASAFLWQYFAQDKAAPRWVTPPVIHATTGEGFAVKARVSLDVADADAKSALEKHMDQVGLLLQAELASHSKKDLAAPGGLEALSEEMRDKLNDYLGTDEDEGVRSVVVGDILYSRP